MRAYSRDLRDRILRDSDAGLTAVAVAEKYDVSRAWVDRLKQRRRETGEVAPRAQRYGPHPKRGPHLHRLADLIQEQPDRTLAELKEALGLSASLATIETRWPCSARVSRAPLQPSAATTSAIAATRELYDHEKRFSL